MRSSSRMLLALAVLVMACSDSPTDVRPSELEVARQTWATKGYPTYQFTIHMACFCAVNGPIRAAVVNDSLVSATVIADGQPVDPRWVPSIKKLFDFIQNGIDHNAAVLRVDYDAVLGYPKQIVYDGAVNAADDELTYTVSDVVLSGVLNSRR